MAQQQHAADVHPDELCPPNKRYDLMDANKKVDLDHVQCLSESKILTNIIKNHPLRFSIAASSSVPWIYMAQFWHTLKEDGSKYRLRFMLDKKELTLTLDDFRQIFHLPQATANNHNSFVPPPHFLTWRSTRLTPPALVPTVDKADEMILQDTLQVSLAEHKSREEQEARENVALNIVDDSSIPRNDESNIPGTRIEPQSDKESPEVEIAKEKEVEIAKEKEVEISKEKEVELTNVVIPVNVNDEDEEIMIRCKKLKRGRKDVMATCFAQLRARFARKSFDTLADNLHDVMVETLPTMVDKHIKEQVMKQVPEQVRNQVPVNIQAQISTQIKNAIANVIPSQVDASVRSYMSGHILHVRPAWYQIFSKGRKTKQNQTKPRADLKRARKTEVGSAQ
ncbi:hypothetical protein Tco_0502092 [Tanacetum coccineum]